jgi:hypothetical protein
MSAHWSLDHTMAWSTDQSAGSSVWALARAQHGVVTRAQLLDLGLSARAIDHRIKTWRLRLILRSVYAVGRPQLTSYGHWIAARLDPAQLEAAVNEADKRDLADPETLRAALDDVVAPRPGVATCGKRSTSAPLPPHARGADQGPSARPGARGRRLTPLRFTHAQVRLEPGRVRATLAAVARRLEAELPR